MNRESLFKRMEAIRDRVNANAHLMHRGRFLNARIKLAIDEREYLLHIAEGRIVSLSPAMPLFQTIDLVIRGSAAAWTALWEPVPEAGWHDLFALCKRGEMRIEGDSQVLFSHLQYLKDVLATPRERVLA